VSKIRPHRSLLFLLLAPATAAALTQVEARHRPSLEALPISETLVVDGALDETAWARAAVGKGFIQREPFDGRPATEDTEVRIVYTPSTLYVGIVAHDSQPGAVIAREMGRDSPLFRDDSVAVLLDTFLDRRNGYFFETNANGAKTDALVTDEGRDVNFEWDGVWTVAARRTPDGWQVEIAIPFSTLRYDPALDTWGLQVLRRIRRNNEETYWAPLPREAGLMRLSMAGDLRGLGGLEPTRQVDVKPFVVGSRDSAGEDQGTDTDIGLDVKWGVARNLALDVTINTDFAEVEVDELQVNLTRFPLFFPEKREFFLENAGIFEFGPSGSGGGPPLLKVFFSRRIGLEEDQEIPVVGGLRFTGRAGGWNLGALGVRTEAAHDLPDIGDVGETNFGVIRLKRNLGERSSVGLIATHRDERGAERNLVYGVDADFKPTDRVRLNGFIGRSDDPALDGNPWALGLGTSYEGRSLELELDYLEIGEDFDPEVGFLLRENIRRYRPAIEYEPRIERWGIRNLAFEASAEYVNRLSDGAMETRNLELGLFGLRTFQNDGFVLNVGLVDEQLFEDFEIADGVVLPPGRYEADPRWGLFAFTGDHRLVSLHVGLADGGFYDGDRLGIFSMVRLRPSRHFRGEASWSYNDVVLPAGAFTTNVYRLRLDAAFTPEHLLGALLQYDDAGELVGANLRYNWIYRPGADLFVVYNESWDAPSLGALTTSDRRFIVKFTYLFQR